MIEQAKKLLLTLRARPWSQTDQESANTIDALVAEVERLSNHIHTCGPNCTKAGCMNKRLMEEVESLRKDAGRGRYMIDNGCWHRGEEQTHLAVLVPHGSDLSCYATREAAIDAAMQGVKE